MSVAPQGASHTIIIVLDVVIVVLLVVIVVVLRRVLLLEALGSLKSLTELGLEKNQLSGKIPEATTPRRRSDDGGRTPRQRSSGGAATRRARYPRGAKRA